MNTIVECGLIAIVRLSSPGPLERVAAAIVEGGIDVVEFTMNTPGALDALSRTKKELGEAVCLGAGTVLNPGDARRALDAGAEFIVSPDIRRDVVELTKAEGRASIPGAYTPTEIAVAIEAGADLVKVFPANLLGPEYIRAVRAPLSNARLMPTGGVNLENMSDYVAAGATALALGSSLVSDARVTAGDFAAITGAARNFREAFDALR